MPSSRFGCGTGPRRFTVSSSRCRWRHGERRSPRRADTADKHVSAALDTLLFTRWASSTATRSLEWALFVESPAWPSLYTCSQNVPCRGLGFALDMPSIVPKHLVLFLTVIVRGFVLTPTRSCGEKRALVHVDSADRVCDPLT